MDVYVLYAVLVEGGIFLLKFNIDGQRAAKNSFVFGRLFVVF